MKKNSKKDDIFKAGYLLGKYIEEIERLKEVQKDINEELADGHEILAQWDFLRFDFYLKKQHIKLTKWQKEIAIILLPLFKILFKDKAPGAGQTILLKKLDEYLAQIPKDD